MISHDAVKELFDYKNGHLFWRASPHGRVGAGSRAGCIDRNGYVRIGVQKKVYAAHRLIFLWHYGRLPETIDHINHNRTDNRIENLRAATVIEARRNRRRYKNNTTGAKGVTRNKHSFVASLMHRGKRIHLGSFRTLTEAAHAYDKKARELHKEFALTNYPEVKRENGQPACQWGVIG